MLQESGKANRGTRNEEVKLDYFLSVRELAPFEECFYEFAFASKREIGESFEPVAVGNNGIGAEPTI